MRLPRPPLLLAACLLPLSLQAQDPPDVQPGVRLLGASSTMWVWESPFDPALPTERKFTWKVRPEYGVGHNLGGEDYLGVFLFSPLTFGNDHYNDWAFNASFVPLAGSLLNYLFLRSHARAPEAGVTKALLLLQTLVQGQHYMILLNDYRTVVDFQSPTLLAYLRTQTDWYVLQNTRWFRYAPGVGVAVTFGTTLLEAGFQFQWDYIGDDWTSRAAGHVALRLAILD